MATVFALFLTDEQADLCSRSVSEFAHVIHTETVPDGIQLVLRTHADAVEGSDELLLERVRDHHGLVVRSGPRLWSMPWTVDEYMRAHESKYGRDRG